MVGRIFRAKATKRMKNSAGKLRMVKKNQLIYHRGKGRYAIYSTGRDVARKSKTRKFSKGYGHTGDKTARGR